MSGRSPTAQPNPFPGLRPYRPDEDFLFFGRENQVDVMVDGLSATNFLAVVGTSGSGKSSLVNCGLRPALHGGLMATAGTKWRVAQFRPGNDPIAAMAQSLAAEGVLFDPQPSGGLSMAEMVETTLRMSKLGLLDTFAHARPPEGVNLLVVVDQFEELFRYRNLGVPGRAGGASDQAAEFVNLLLAVTNRPDCRVFVVLTMRSDFLGDCAEFRGLAEAITASQYLVPRMTRDERRAAIVGPVGVGGAKISPLLVTRLVNDVGDNPDQLPILQHALNRTWARWQDVADADDPISLEHYEAVGSMEHALDHHAEEVLAELETDRARLICKRMFMALTDKATDHRGVRRPTRFDTLRELTEASTPELTDVIDRFRRPDRSFLMPPAGEPLDEHTVVDISHESLMRVWKRLGRWADDEAESAREYRRLADLAERYHDGKERLVTNPNLALFLRWWEESQPNQAWANRYDPNFQRASNYLHRSHLAAKRKRTMAVAGVMALAGAVVVFALLATWALDQREEAQLAQRDAIDAQLVAEESQRVASLAQLAAEDSAASALAGSAVASAEQNPALALTLAAESAAIAHEPATVDKVASALVTARNAFANTSGQPVGGSLTGHVSPVNDVTFDPDQTMLVSASEDGTIRFWDAATGAEAREPLDGGTVKVHGVAFNPDGTLLAYAGDDGTVRLWDPSTGEQVGPPFTGHTENWVSGVAYSHDGTRIASSGQDMTVRLWDPATGRQVGAALTGHEDEVRAVTFSPDDRLVASASRDGTVRLWDTATGTQVGAALAGHADTVRKVAFNADGTLLASAGEDRTVRLWDPATGAQVGDPLLHSDGVRGVAFSPDGALVVSAGDDGTVRLWDTATRVPVGVPLTGHAGSVQAVTFSPDGTRVASGGGDRAVRMWAVGGLVDGPLAGHTDQVISVAFSPDGAMLASASNDKTVLLWDPATGGSIGAPLTGHGDKVVGVAFSPDGTLLASASRDATARLWDPVTGDLVAQLDGHDDNVNAVAFSPDGELLASVSHDLTVRLWNPATGEPVGEPLEGHTGTVRAVAFNDDGTLLASSGDDFTIRLWDPTTGENVRTLTNQTEDAVYAVAFNANGTVLASGDNDGTVILWDPATEEQVATLTGHTKAVDSVAYSPDGRWLASASVDGTVRLWNPATREPVGAPLAGHVGTVRAVAFSADGRWLASAGDDETVRLWDRLGDVELACELAMPYVLPEQVQEFLANRTAMACISS